MPPSANVTPDTSGAYSIDIAAATLFMRQRAILDIEDAIGEFEQSGIVRHDQNGPAVLPRGVGEDRHDRLAVLAIQRRGWLIGQDGRRFSHNSAGNGDPL